MFIFFCIGFSIGAGVLWAHFLHSRLIRTRDEWYADPAIQRRYPGSYAKYLSESGSQDE